MEMKLDIRGLSVGILAMGMMGMRLYDPGYQPFAKRSEPTPIVQQNPIMESPYESPDTGKNYLSGEVQAPTVDSNIDVSRDAHYTKSLNNLQSDTGYNTMSPEGWICGGREH
jgi:hypothetical protein